MKLFLTKKEKELLAQEYSIEIERTVDSAPIDSIWFGNGDKHIWDKVDRCWVYGNTDAYIQDRMNVGRRAQDYKDNRSKWWECERCFDNYGPLNQVIENGKKNVIRFSITERQVILQKCGSYYDVVLKMRVTSPDQKPTGYSFDDRPLANELANIL